MGNFIKHVTPEQTVCYENLVKMTFLQAVAGTGFVAFEQGVPLEINVAAFYQFPKTLSQKKRLITKHAVKKPDADNVLKIICDALNGVAWHDDSQISHAEIWKFTTHESPRVEITINKL